MQLSNAHVVLTGASGGIGLALCDALCKEGAKVLAIARNT
ncbi:SDR family NAD(P)-dependent oxidoreductase, partial [uncultured Acinetobacter sp.]